MYEDNSASKATVLIIGTIGFVTLLVFGKGCCVGPEQKHAAEKEAKMYARDLGLNPTGISCNDVDSDGDGYVSCTLAIGADTKQIECRGAY